MKIEIWTKSTYKHDRDEFRGRSLPCVLLFLGEWPVVPRVGEHVDPFGWASDNPVLEVWHKLDSCEVHIYVAPDYSGEFLEEARKRGIPQPFYKDADARGRR